MEARTLRRTPARRRIAIRARMNRFYVLEGEYEVTVGARLSMPLQAPFCLARAEWHTASGIPEKGGAVAPHRAAGGNRKLFREISQWVAAGPPDLSKLVIIAANYGIEVPL